MGASRTAALVLVLATMSGALILVVRAPFDRWMGSINKTDLNVLLVTLDTTRADYINAYGLRDADTPTLDRLARDGTLFEHATSVAPLTLPAHCSLLTGVLPDTHGVRDNGQMLGAQPTLSLARVLKDRGFRTAAFTASVVVGAHSGLNDGFDVYDDLDDGRATDASSSLRRPADEVVDAALQWVARQEGSPFFAWLHLYDAHAPYLSPDAFRAWHPHDPYASAIAFIDAQLARVFRELESHRLYERTVVVVVGDHGEGLGEHGEATHGVLLYESVLHVPLIIRTPDKATNGRRVDAVVRSIDVMPTVLDLVGIAPPASLQGISLVPLMTGARQDLDLEAYSETLYPNRFGWSALHSIRAGRHKFVLAPRSELYDLHLDPAEKHNLIDVRPRLAQVMAQRLAGFVRSGNAKPRATSTADGGDRQSELAALGYFTRSAVMEVDQVSTLPHPKDKIQLFNRLVEHAAARRTNGRDAQ